MKKSILILIIPILFSFQEIISQNAPKSTVGNVISYGTTAIVPINVTDFVNINGCDLLLNYDPSIATATSVTLGPGLGSIFFIPDVTIPGVVTIAWLNLTSQTLPDNSVFVNISFDKVTNGFTEIEFNTNNPIDCDWYTYQPTATLNDVPQSDYYFDGSLIFADASYRQWTGNIDDDWSDPLNWDVGVPGVGNVAVINDVSPNFFPAASANAECLDLIMLANASVTVPATKSLTVHGNFVNNGQFTVQSSAAGEGSLINYGSITGNGTVTVERYLVSEGWHYVSSPIADGLSEIFAGIYLMEWDEPTSLWSFIVPTDVLLNPMEGYAAWADDSLTGTTTISYESTSPNLNSGSLTSGPLTADGPNTTPPEDNRGFNFVGNPYTSAVDWDEVSGWNKTTLADAIYIWNPAAGQYGSYINGLPTNGVSNIIPGGQGFYVHNPNDFTIATLTVNNNARVHSTQPFLKALEVVDQQLITLSVTSEINSYSDEVIVYFAENATTGFDQKYDAMNLKGNVEAPDLYTVSPDGKNLSINSYPGLVSDVVIPVGCEVGIDGYYTISVEEIAINEPVQVLLFDIITNTFIDLNNQDSYTFFSETSGIDERFELHFYFNPSGTMDIMDSQIINIYAANNTIFIKKHDSKVLKGNLQVYDLLGRLIESSSIDSQDQFELPLNEQGIFVVSYFDQVDQKEYRQKIFLQ